MPTTLFEKQFRVFGSPSRYLQGVGAIQQLQRFVGDLGSRAIIVTDGFVLSMIGDTLRENLDNVGLSYEILEFSGALLPETAAQLLANYTPAEGDVVVAIGGGRAIDTGKALAEHAKSALITVPTVASTDAPTSKNFVIYDEDHKLLEVRHLPKNPDAVIVDTEILSKAPKHMFAAGIGDALAKYAEAKACNEAGGINMFEATPTRVALGIARTCHETLMEYGIAAYDVAGSGQPDENFEAAVEATTLMAGLGFENGGLSVAHALTRGLSLVAGAKDAQHGFQVAYGIVVQAALAKEPLPKDLVKLMSHTGLPQTLTALCGREATAADFETIADATISVRHMNNFPASVTKADLFAALNAVETAQAKTLEKELG